jgi:aspartyl-tRNA(Asn)/glutamyl-tRNA(Gln) amidotransferase subunit B
MRFDVNVSVSTDPAQPGTRTETKNLNSFRSVEAVVNYEIKRQTELLEKGEKIRQETRGWDEAKQKTTSQRGKEEAEDYRYMPEPDIPPLELDQKFVDQIKASVPALPGELRHKLSSLKIDQAVAEDLLDSPAKLDHVLKVLAASNPDIARLSAFWIIRAPEAEELNLDIDRVVELGQMMASGQLNSNAAQRIYDELPKTDQSPAELAEALNLLQVSDESAIEAIVEQVLADNPDAVADIKAGQDKAIGFLVGQVMTKSKGQANPGLAQRIIRGKLKDN